MSARLNSTLLAMVLAIAAVVPVAGAQTTLVAGPATARPSQAASSSSWLTRELLNAASSRHIQERSKWGSGGGLFPLLGIERSRGTLLQQPSSQATGKAKGSAMGWAIAIGIAAGATVSGIAASKYGENETGGFCTRCFVQWSAVSIPVGAGVGAGVGYVIDRVRR